VIRSGKIGESQLRSTILSGLGLLEHCAFNPPGFFLFNFPNLRLKLLCVSKIITNSRKGKKIILKYNNRNGGGKGLGENVSAHTQKVIRNLCTGYSEQNKNGER